MVKCNKVDFYREVWRLKTVERKVVEVKKAIEEAKRALKSEPSTVKAITKVVKIEVR
jgi:hypothetical protein